MQKNGCSLINSGQYKSMLLKSFSYLYEKELKQLDTYIIYLHKNKITKKVYIGQTKDTMERRARGGSGYQGCPHFYRAIQESGWENFDHLILEEGLTSKQADEREKYWIAVFDATNPKKGYNIKTGGKVPNHPKNRSACKKVYCKETGQCFESLTAAAIWAGLTSTGGSNIASQIKGERLSAGKHPITKEPLHWCFEKQDLLNNNLLQKRKKPGAKKVKNLDTGEIFDSINDAAKKYNISNVTISKSCKSKGQIAVGGNKGPKYRWIFLN